MKRPEDIPQEIVSKFASALGSEYSDAAICQHTAEDVRKALAAVWDDIFGAGYTDGFSDREMSEQDAEMVEKHGWSPHFLFWFEGATSDEAEALIDKMIEAGEDGKPEHINMAGVGALTVGHRHAPRD